MKSNRAVVYNNLSVMLEAGVPIVRSLRTVGSGGKGPVAGTFDSLADLASSGVGLPEAMAKYPKVFRPLDVLVAEIGQNSGNLPESFKQLSDWYDFCTRMRRIFISGLILPVLVLHIAAVVSGLPFFLLGHIDLTGYFICAVRILAMFYVPVMVFLVIMRLRLTAGAVRRLVDLITLKIPVLGRAVRELALSRYCRAFHMLLSAGVPAVQCAEKSAELTGNVIMAGRLRSAAESARAGNTFSEGFSDELPAIFVESWRIGEETGSLDDVTLRLAESTGQTAEWRFTQFAKWLPRIAYFLFCIYMAYRIIQAYMVVLPIGNVEIF